MVMKLSAVLALTANAARPICLMVITSITITIIIFVIFVIIIVVNIIITVVVTSIITYDDHIQTA